MNHLFFFSFAVSLSLSVSLCLHWTGLFFPSRREKVIIVSSGKLITKFIRFYSDWMGENWKFVSFVWFVCRSSLFHFGKRLMQQLNRLISVFGLLVTQRKKHVGKNKFSMNNPEKIWSTSRSLGLFFFCLFLFVLIAVSNRTWLDYLRTNHTEWTYKWIGNRTPKLFEMVPFRLPNETRSVRFEISEDVFNRSFGTSGKFLIQIGAISFEWEI